MRRRRRRGPFLLAALLAAVTLAASGVRAVGDDVRTLLASYTEAVTLAHAGYGREVHYRALVYASIQGMLRTLDPHTTFLSPEAYSGMRQRQEETFFGVGILVSMRNGLLTVITPVDGGPAARLGLRTGDVISAVDGESTEGMSLDEAVRRIKGPRGTKVTLEILRPGLEGPQEVVIVRDEIQQTTVRYAYLIAPGVGYLRITDFGRGTGREVAEAIGRLREAGMERLLLDLRSNGGGLLDQAIAVADLFLPAGAEIVETRGRLPSSFQEYVDDPGDPDPELALPLVVLVNRGTASAAEILSGTIQDHDVGLLVGTTTWGKGLVQTVFSLSHGAGLALTTARYHTPSGRMIQRDYGSLFDYYGVERQADASTAEPERQRFYTAQGRAVYGGGGITPDVVVEIPDAPAELEMLYLLNAFFDFAVDYHRRHPEIGPGWEPGAGIVDELADWLRETERLPADEVRQALADDEVREAARRQIHADVFTSALGTEAAHRVLAAGDEQIQAALGRLDEAAELLAGRGR